MPVDDYTITNAILLANTNATGYQQQANAAVATARAALGAAGYGNVNWTPITPPSGPDLPPLPPVPQLTPPQLNMPTDVGDGPQLMTPPDVNPGDAPTFNVTPPSLTTLNAPTGLLLSVPTTPTLNTVTFPAPPAALDTALPTAPTTRADQIPTPILITNPAPEFIALPAADPGNPDMVLSGQTAANIAESQAMVTMLTGSTSYMENHIKRMYPSIDAQETLLSNQLAKYMAGGTALNATVEQQIYDRARAKNDLEAKRVQDAATKDAAARGWTLPAGAVASTLALARRDAANANARVSADIAIAQAEMEQKNLQFAVGTIVDLKKTMVSSSMTYLQQVVSMYNLSFEHAKSTFANIVEMYNSALKVYTARTDAYRTYAQVYETRMKQALFNVETYKAQLQGIEAATNIDLAQVNIYKAKIESTQALAAYYKVKVDAAIAQVTMERSKIDIFQSQIQAYGAQIQAKNAEWQGFSAQVAGQEAMVRMYASQVQSFNSRIDAYKAQAETKITYSRSVSEKNSAAVASYNSKVQAYNSRVSAEVTKMSALNDNNKATIANYSRQLEAFHGQTTYQLAQYQTQAEVAIKNATGSLSAQTELARAKTEYGFQITNLNTSMAKIYSDLVSASLSGINTLAAATSTVVG